MIIVGLPYSHQGQMSMAEIVGGARISEVTSQSSAFATVGMPTAIDPDHRKRTS